MNILNAKSFIFVWFKIIWFAITSFATLGDLYKRVNLEELRVWLRDSNISLSIYFTCSILLKFDIIRPGKKRVHRDMLVVSKIKFFSYLIKILSKTTKRLLKINLITCYTY